MWLKYEPDFCDAFELPFSASLSHDGTRLSDACKKENSAIKRMEIFLASWKNMDIPFKFPFCDSSANRARLFFFLSWQPACLVAHKAAPHGNQWGALWIGTHKAAPHGNEWGALWPVVLRHLVTNGEPCELWPIKLRYMVMNVPLCGLRGCATW